MKTAGTMDAGAEIDISEYQKWSTATLTIVVKRLPDFYVWNFIAIVVMLVIVSFFSFKISKSSLDARLGLTLTVGECIGGGVICDGDGEHYHPRT